MKTVIDLTGKVALVTGASSGIGAAAAALMGDLGARVAIGFHQNQAGADRVHACITGRGGTATPIRADVRRSDEIRNLVARATDAFGPIDILVNNAGSLVTRQRIADITEQRWDEILGLNLTSAMLCAQAVAPSMMARRQGAIVNVVSIAGRNGGGIGAGAYASAKGGLIALTKSLARELAPHGVRVNAISPGVIDTPFHETFSTPEMMKGFVAAIPLGRVGTSAECASTIAFLASDAASYIVGETIEVNGGQLML
jgi:3-oxoacyl-[acyl-carrier protein] reductase